MKVRHSARLDRGRTVRLFFSYSLKRRYLFAAAINISGMLLADALISVKRAAETLFIRPAFRARAKAKPLAFVI